MFLSKRGRIAIKDFSHPFAELNFFFTGELVLHRTSQTASLIHLPSSKVIIMGTKRASPGAEDEKSPLQIAELNENAKKLEEIQRDLARAELVLGKAFRNYEGRVFD